MKLTLEEIKKLSELARIELTSDEIKKYREQLSSILDYVAQLSEVDTSKINFKGQQNKLNNIFKDDEIRQYKDTRKIIRQFPKQAGNLNKVKPVLDK